MNEPVQTKERGGCLTLWLVVALIGTGLASLMYIFGSSSMEETYPDTDTWLFTALGIASVFQFISAAGIWMWKRWGVYGYAVIIVLGLGLNLAIGTNIAVAFGSTVIGGAILYALIKDKWDYFD